MTTADLILHPVRLRIVQRLLGGRSLTTTQLREELPDIAQATLYRQVALLLDAGVMVVVDERRVRGTVERTVALADPSPSVNAEEAAQMTVEEHRRSFLTFVAGLVGALDRYLDSDEVDLGRDMVGYRQAAVHLSDREMEEFLADLAAVVRPRLDNEPSSERTRRLLTTVVMPDR